MTDTPNPYLREHVTSIGFNLTLSKSMIDLVVLMHHYRGDYDRMMCGKRWGAGDPRPQRNPDWTPDDGWLFHPVTRQHISTTRSLMGRGLIERTTTKRKRTDLPGFGNERIIYKLTPAGKLVVGLLKEAGIYQDRVHELGLEKKEEVA